VIDRCLLPSSHHPFTLPMDFLKAEIAAKKRKATGSDDNGESSIKFIRRGEEERKREEEYRTREAAKKGARIEKMKDEERHKDRTKVGDYDGATARTLAYSSACATVKVSYS
jgi:hypothetical protein